MRRGLLVLVAVAACWKGPMPQTRPMAIISPVDTFAFSQRVDSADGYIAGVIQKIDADWTYDDKCGLFLAAFGQCTGTSTYTFKVVGNGVQKWLWVFVPTYGYLPLVAGMDATFLYRHVYAFQYGRCQEWAAVGGSAYCPADELPTVLNERDVVPRADSALVARLFGKPR